MKRVEFLFYLFSLWPWTRRQSLCYPCSSICEKNGLCWAISWQTSSKTLCTLFEMASASLGLCSSQNKPWSNGLHTRSSFGSYFRKHKRKVGLKTGKGKEARREVLSGSYYSKSLELLKPWCFGAWYTIYSSELTHLESGRESGEGGLRAGEFVCQWLSVIGWGLLQKEGSKFPCTCSLQNRALTTRGSSPIDADVKR